MRARDVGNPQWQNLHHVFQQKCHWYQRLRFSAEGRCVNYVVWADAVLKDSVLSLLNHSANTADKIII